MDAQTYPRQSRAPEDRAMPPNAMRTLLQRSRDSREAQDDLAHGQVVIVAARWVLVAAGLVLSLWNPAAIGPLRLQVLVLLMIAVGNFFLHAQVLKRHGTIDKVAYAASAADLGVITLLVASQGGYDSNLFVFFFPAVLALSVAFTGELTAVYTGITMGIYGLVCIESLGLEMTSDHVQTIIVRTLMVAAVAVCGALYQRVESQRRKSEAFPDGLLDELDFSADPVR